MKRSILNISLVIFVLFLVFSANVQAETNIERIARILKAEDSLQYDGYLEKVLLNKDLTKEERLLAARAIGHIGNPSGSIPLLQALKDQSLDQVVLLQALGWLWGNTPLNAIELNKPPEVLKVLLKTAGEEQPMLIRAAAFNALALAFPTEGQLLAAKAAEVLAGQGIDSDAEQLFVSLLRVAAQEKKKLPPLQEAQQGEDPRLRILRAGLNCSNKQVAYYAACFAARSVIRELPLEKDLVAGLDRQEPNVRAQMLRALQRRDRIELTDMLKEKAFAMLQKGETQEKIAAVEFIAKHFPADDAFKLLQKALSAAGHKQMTGLHQVIIDSIATLKADGVVEYLWDLSLRKMPYHRLARLAAAKAGATDKVEALSAERYAVDETEAAFYVETLSLANARNKLEWLLTGEGVPEIFARNINIRRRIVLALVYGQNYEATGDVAAKRKELLYDPDPVIRAAISDSAGMNSGREWIAELGKAWRRAKQDRAADVALSVLGAFEQMSKRKNDFSSAAEAVLTELARQGLEDERLEVRRKSAVVLYTMTRERHEKEMFGVKTGRSDADYEHLAKRLLNAAKTTKMRLSTNKGDLILVIRHDLTPLTADNFVRLATTGFYDGLVFHRVIPGFVAQGGDPIGLGMGGPGYSIREEEGVLPFTAGALGMATAGHDTGGSQFFITEMTWPHLDGSYTAFGNVEGEGSQAIIEALVAGDRIVSIKPVY